MGRAIVVSDGSRQSKRLDKDLEVVWAAGAGGRSGRGRLLDVSASGARLRVQHQLRRGEMVSLVCSGMASLPGQAIVQWCRRTEAANGYHCGVAFERVIPADELK